MNNIKEEIKSTVFEMNNILEGIKSRLDEADNLISELEDEEKKKSRQSNKMKNCSKRIILRREIKKATGQE